MKWSKAKKRHRRLIRKLGGKCWRCGTTKNLTVDHPHGRKIGNRDPRTRKKSYLQRVNEYWLEFADGKPLRPACNTCNGQTGGGRRIKIKTVTLNGTTDINLGAMLDDMHKGTMYRVRFCK